MKKTHIFPIFAMALLLCAGNAGAYSINLPENACVIREESFKGDINLEKLILHDKIEAIESKAFAGTNLRSIYATDMSSIKIASDAFDGKTLYVFPMKTTELRLICGQSGQINFSRYPAPTLPLRYTYEMANPYAVEVDEHGSLRTLRSGETELTITDSDGNSATLTVIAEKWADSHPCISIAHRGASAYCPDNSLDAFRLAHTLGAEMIELDVRRTADGELVCHHDAVITISDCEHDLDECTLEQILEADEDICSFRQALQCIKELGDIRLLVELKETGIEECAIELVDAAGMESRVCYGSFNWDSISAIETLDPDIQTVYIVNSASRIKSIADHPEIFPTDAFSIAKGYLGEGTISKIHLAGKKVYGWTIDDPDEIDYYRSICLDGITTNRPDLA